jgi:hypothetical protein
MSRTETSAEATERHSGPLLSVGIGMSLCIFFGTYLAYSSRHEAQAPGSYLPLAIGTAIFLGLMVCLHYLSSSSQSLLVRIVKAVGIALFETILFLLLFLFFVVNTLGS